jgi:hypothetical protein
MLHTPRASCVTAPASDTAINQPPETIAELRRLLNRTQPSSMADGLVASFGIEDIDRWLPGGGLAMGAVHEICEQGLIVHVRPSPLYLP